MHSFIAYLLQPNEFIIEIGGKLKLKKERTSYLLEAGIL